MDYTVSMRCKIIILALTCLTLSGCAGIKSWKWPGRAKELQRAKKVQSRIDSLIAEGTPTDTMVLEISEKNATISNRENHMDGNTSVQAGFREKNDGYRVQLASSQQRKDLEALVQRVERELESNSYIEMFAGRFCLRVGDFRGRLEAEELQKRAVSFGFKYAWVVQTAVSPPR